MSFLGSLWAVMRAQPIAAAVAVSTLGVGAAGTGTAGYWVYGQPNPQILAVETPWTNAGTPGVSADARAYPVTAGMVPVPKTTFRAGETMWTVRHDCFLFKTSGPITRVFRSIDDAGNLTGVNHQLPLTYPPTRTEGCAKRNFATPIPAELTPGRWRYEVAVLFYKNPLQPEVRTLFPSVDITVVK